MSAIGLEKLLLNLNASKAAGPDKLTVSPVYKKECRSNPANYSPVSLTCILCKILEHIINRHILDHLDEHRILVDAQHGFRKRRFCETQLILTSHNLAKVVNDSGQVDMLVLDFAKLLKPLPTSDSWSKRVQPTRGWTVAASTQHKLYSLLLPPVMRTRFYRFLGRPAKWTRWLAGAAAIKSG